MKRLIVIVAVMVLAGGDTGRADFVLTGSEHLEVNSSHDASFLYDSSMANVVQGGSISNAYVHNASSMAVSGGSIDNLQSYQTSSVVISGGQITNALNSWDTSSVDVSGGVIYRLYANDTSRVDISGGGVNYLYATDFSRVTIHGYDFRVTSTLANLRLEGERVLGANGYLSYERSDGTRWDMVIVSNSENSTIWVAPPDPVV